VERPGFEWIALDQPESRQNEQVPMAMAGARQDDYLMAMGHEPGDHVPTDKPGPAEDTDPAAALLGTHGDSF